ncbi:predicted protein [Arabidopsis lyrata subsp. lyrata]|uniref:Predicted protein n=1 Tax=Arabidopsis lyrata subsp. lyrata TaxID=81972 RepID=D7MWC4_ARALL|nr:predicted protein [Arabidopsis lyrata subsp. lyrata]
MSTVLKKVGFTTWLGSHTNTQYVMASTLAKDLGFKLLSVILLYFNMDPSKYIGSTDHKTTRNIAGWSGLAFSSFSLIDIVLRTKFKDLRIFDEAAIICLFGSLSALYFSMFELNSLIFISSGGVFLLVAIIMVVGNRCRSGVVPAELHPELRLLIEALKEDESLQNPQVLMQLKSTIFIMMMTNSDDPHALALLDIVKSRTTTTPPPP